MIIGDLTALALSFASPNIHADGQEEHLISQTWALEYDVAITPFIDDYRRCLNYGNRIASGRADFEQQHRADIPRCEEVYDNSIDAANRMMASRGRANSFTPSDVTHAFDTIGIIHVERGRFIDKRFQQRATMLAQYQAANTPTPSALDLSSSEQKNNQDNNQTNAQD